MSNKTFKKCVYIVIAILVIIFYTKDIDFSNNNFYKNIKEIDNYEDYDALVNKNNKLPLSYVPKDLGVINVKYANENKQLRHDALVAFELLAYDASISGYKIVAVSAYRNYEYQENLYNEYVETKGSKYADSCSARPGHSEHQTGLAVDVMGSNQDYDLFEESEEFKWMKDNAYKYGFILRYPKNKSDITGFKYEPWHYRYVGEELATLLYFEELTLEEYYDKFVEKNNE